MTGSNINKRKANIGLSKEDQLTSQGLSAYLLLVDILSVERTLLLTLVT